MLQHESTLEVSPRTFTSYSPSALTPQEAEAVTPQELAQTIVAMDLV